MHLGVVDRFNSLQVSAFTTATRIKFLLLHEGRSDDLVKSFFRDVYELYLRVKTWEQRAGLQAGQLSASWLMAVLKCHPAFPTCCICFSAVQVMLNPFHTPTSKITTPLFHQKVRQLARSYFR
jgi:hypothetical protein